MKILTDLQACQSLPHKDRGIGRYALSLAAEMHRLRGAHGFSVALNAGIPNTIEAVRAAMPTGARIAPWAGITRTSWQQHGNDMRRAAAMATREVALAREGAHIHHISSFFEGYADDVVVDIERQRRIPVAATLFDLIPLLYQDLYLPDERMRRWYFDRVEVLKRADLLLAISECTRRDAIEHLGIDPDRVVNISAAVDPRFRPCRFSPQVEAALRARFGIEGRILLYTGGIDHRKNLGRLIEAFAKVEPESRRGTQLAIVCDMDGEAARALRTQATAVGLAGNELVLTGYVSDADLVALYNLCEAFVFPSWYEGFGLPVLEAMACGAPVIASDRASVPEVVGRGDALFDPFDTDQMAARISQVLCDPGFRLSLHEHALRQSRNFSWAGCAERAIGAMQAIVRNASATTRMTASKAAGEKPTLAFVSPLPPEQTGIANYSGELLPHLAGHYRIVVITDQAVTEPAPDWAQLEIRDVAWFQRNATSFDRILYQFGNSAFHGHMFGLLERFGGVAVLHDFFLSGVASHLQWASKVPGFWDEYLYRSHGYPALVDRASGVDPEEMLLRYPCNGPVVENADGVIVHSRHSCKLAEDFYGEQVADDWSVVPLLKTMPADVSRAASRAELGIGADDFLVCSFGILGDAKLNAHLLAAWRASSLATDDRCRLVFVGGAHDPKFAESMRRQIASGAGAHRVSITGYVSAEDYRRYLQAADVAVQLRRHSRGETSAALFDCLSHGVATVANAHGSMAELDPDVVALLQDEFESASLANVLEKLHSDPAYRKRLGEAGQLHCREKLDPRTIAGEYRQAIERAYKDSAVERVREAGSTMIETWRSLEESDRIATAEAMAANLPTRTGTRQLLVDVTELVRRDAKSGIQRVVRSIVSCLLKAPPRGYRVEPVYAANGGGYRYARAFCCDFLDLGPLPLEDEFVTIRENDVFIGLDLALEEIPSEVAQLQRMRDLGAQVYVVIYDLLPLMRNDCFPSHAEGLFRRWLTSLATVADGAICISRAVADDLVRELDGLEVVRDRPLQVGFFHLGGDVEQSLPTTGVMVAEKRLIESLEAATSFLMVGTIEPRKGHAQALDAFELLWARGGNQRLVIVGKPGWLTEPLIARIRCHPELGGRLLWFEGATDEVLEILYRRCSVLLVPSEGEGFGLPIIEAARHGLSILARNLPVFREVAGEGAYYFDGHEPVDLADAVDRWSELNMRKQAPSSAGVQWLTWKQSADKLVDAAVGGQPYTQWSPTRRRYIPAYDTRHAIVTGNRIRGAIGLVKRAGLVFRTHPIALPAGRYRLKVLGSAGPARGLQVTISGQDGSMAAPLRNADDQQSCADIVTVLALELASDHPGLSISILSDGLVTGEITAIILEPEDPGPENPELETRLLGGIPQSSTPADTGRGLGSAVHEITNQDTTHK